MSDGLYLIGPLAHPDLAQVLGITGDPLTLPVHLAGGAQAGIRRDDWPVLTDRPGETPALRSALTPALARYAEVFGLVPQNHAQGLLLGARDADAPRGDWPPPGWRADLAAALAGDILALPADRPAAQIASRLPMMGVWADSRLRAARGPVSGGKVVARRDADALQVAARRQPYANFFAVEEWDLTHRLHDGGWSPPMTRAGFLGGDAVCLLPWDKRRDRVLVIEQFRFAPAIRHDPQPWLLEPIAGRIDAGETPQQAARREAVEEAGLTVTGMIPAIHHYPSPGAVGEFLYLFIAPTDLPDDAPGLHGLESEAEDIRGHLLPRADLTAMTLAGEITNGPLAMMALWLETRAKGLRAAAG